MRFWVSGPRIGFFRSGVSFGSGFGRRQAPRGRSYARPRGEFVYVVESSNNTVKVGFSSNPEARLATLQTGSALPLSLGYVASTTDAAAVERRAHELLAKHRLQGEWFDCTADAAVAAIHMAGHQLGVGVGEVDQTVVSNERRSPTLGVIMVCLFVFACWVLLQVSSHPGAGTARPISVQPLTANGP